MKNNDADSHACSHTFLTHTHDSNTGVHNLFVIAGRSTFIFMNCGRQSVQDIFIFCISSVLLQHTEPSPLPHVCLAVFLQSIFMQQKIVLINAQQVVINMVCVRSV